MYKKRLLASAVVGTLFVTPSAFAADDYVAGATYVSGNQVCLGGDLYQAKWWAGPDDHPTDVD